MWVQSSDNIEGHDSRILMDGTELPFVELINNGVGWYILSSDESVEVQVGGDNLVAWLGFEETSGTVAFDQSLFANHGDLDAGISFSSNTTVGIEGQALVFDGADDEVEISNPSDALNNGNVITVSFWIKGDPTQPTTYGRPISKSGGGSGGWEVQVQNANPSIQLRVDTSAGTNQLSSALTVLDNTWHHYAFSLSGNVRKIYLDGVEQVNDTFDYGTGFDNTSSVTLGKANNNTKHFQGEIDEVKIFDRALSSEEVAEIYRLRQ